MIKEFLIYFATYLGLFVASFYILSLLENRKNSPLEIKPHSELPFVSIIVPAFNEERGIAGTIESALSIDYPKEKLEIIVVDDGSKDKTYEIASKYQSQIVKVFRMEKNSGKGAAMNLAIKKARGEFIVTMDADNVKTEKDVLKKLIIPFDNPDVMCVAPAMAIYNPKGILQRIQQIEYLMGVFLRKAFSSVNAVHITPGAFSIYRKEFFDKYGGFHEHTLTEDMEMALRIQFNHFVIANNPDAVVYTIAPNKFIPLMKQRRRWYAGMIKNLWDYKKLFSKKYGVLGLIVLPVALISVLTSIILTTIVSTETIMKIQDEISLWNSINFNFPSQIELSKYVIERYLFLFFSDPITIFFIILLGLFLGYLFFAKNKVKKYSSISISLIFFLGFFALLFSFWWIISLIYVISNKKVSWR